MVESLREQISRGCNAAALAASDLGREFLTFYWFIVIYGLTIWIAVGTLGSFQFQHIRDRPYTLIAQEIKSFEGGDYLTTSLEYSELRNQIEVLSRERQKIEASEFFVFIKASDLFRDVLLPGQAEWEQMRQFCLHIPDYEAQNAFYKDEAQWSKHKSNCGKVDFDGLQRLTYEIELAEAKSANLEAQLRNDWLQNHPDHFNTKNFVDRLGLSFFVDMPREALVLFLTMAMGLLGSVLRLTWMKLRPAPDETINFSRSILIPLVGIVSALIIYITLKGGQMVITAGNSNEPLDPFFLSFVGIISGALSDEANTYLQSIGKRFFQNAVENSPRWAINVESELKKQRLEVKALSNVWPFDDSDLDNIVSQQKTANLREQEIIASFLRKPIRDLFSDIPPPSLNKEAVNNGENP